jgi:hypothetical protein
MDQKIINSYYVSSEDYIDEVKTYRIWYQIAIIKDNINCSSKIKILFNWNLRDPFVSWTHIKFFRASEIDEKLRSFDFDIEYKFYKWLWYGKLDLYLWFFSRFIAKLFPSLFAWEVVYLLRNKLWK